MDTLSLAATRSTPGIHFDPAAGVLSISGESYPENSFEFYKPILSWIARFLVVTDGSVTFNIQLSYLNTGSTKYLLDILDLLEESHLSGKQVAVSWYYDPDNERALEVAEEFKEDFTLPFHLCPLSEEA